MKLEKFFKAVGTHGQVVELVNGDKWLVCSGVGMKVPVGVVNLLGTCVASDNVKELVNELTHADTDDKVALTNAVIHVADGKASDIVRVFGKVGIYNAAYGLLEKKDINLAAVTIDDSDLIERHYILVCDFDNEVVGFIEGHLED